MLFFFNAKKVFLYLLYRYVLHFKLLDQMNVANLRMTGLALYWNGSVIQTKPYMPINKVKPRAVVPVYVAVLG